MSEEATGLASGPADSNSLASAIAAANAGPLDPRAVAVLEKQARVLDMQIDSTVRNAKLRRLTLRVGALSTVMKVVLEVAAAFIVLAIAAFLAGAVWKAAHDDSIVIEAFAVPSDLAAKGLTGEVVASQVEDRLSWMDRQAAKSRAHHTNTANNEIKVQIPNTGVSIGDAYRFLAAWLGDQTRVSGELWHDGSDLVLAVRVEGEPPMRFRTQAETGDLDNLVNRAAEYVYRQAQS